MTARRTISTPHAPAAIGPYAQAVVSGGLVHCSGQIALDPKSGQLITGDVRAQTERVLQNLQAVLEAAGTGFDAALKLTVYLVDIADFPAMNEVYARHIQAAAPPARSTVGVAALPRGARVEIDCVAAVRS